MDARQRVKLSLTNHPTGLILTNPHAAAKPQTSKHDPETFPSFVHVTVMIQGSGRSGDLVAMAGFDTPDPFPNSAVKRPCADGTASQDVGE